MKERPAWGGQKHGGGNELEGLLSLFQFLAWFNGPDDARLFSAALAIGLGGFAPALAIGWLVSRAMEALGRNPEAQPVIQTNMILGVAFAEAIAIYALVVAIMIGFVF